MLLWWWWLRMLMVLLELVTCDLGGAVV